MNPNELLAKMFAAQQAGPQMQGPAVVQGPPPVAGPPGPPQGPPGPPQKKKGKSKPKGKK